MTQLPVPTEAEEGKVLVAYLRVHNLPFTHIPNETGHSPEAKRRAIRMKQQGTSRGFPDYIVFIPSGVVFIELKRKRGSTVSPEQREWVDRINATPGAEGYICKGADEAIKILEGFNNATTKNTAKTTVDTEF